MAWQVQTIAKKQSFESEELILLNGADFAVAKGRSHVLLFDNGEGKGWSKVWGNPDFTRAPPWSSTS